MHLPLSADHERESAAAAARARLAARSGPMPRCPGSRPARPGTREARRVRAVRVSLRAAAAALVVSGECVSESDHARALYLTKESAGIGAPHARPPLRVPASPRRLPGSTPGNFTGGARPLKGPRSPQNGRNPRTAGRPGSVGSASGRGRTAPKSSESPTARARLGPPGRVAAFSGRIPRAPGQPRTPRCRAERRGGPEERTRASPPPRPAGAAASLRASAPGRLPLDRPPRRQCPSHGPIPSASPPPEPGKMPCGARCAGGRRLYCRRLGFVGGPAAGAAPGRARAAQTQ